MFVFGFVVGDILLFVFLMPVIFLKTNFIVVIYPISSFPKALRQILKMLLRWLDDNSNFSVWRQALNPALWQPSPDWSVTFSVIRATSALRWCLADLIIPVHTFTQYILMAALTSSRLSRWDLVLLPQWLFSKQVFNSEKRCANSTKPLSIYFSWFFIFDSSLVVFVTYNPVLAPHRLPWEFGRSVCQIAGAKCYSGRNL